MKYIIKDWAGNICFDGAEFDSFDDGWDRILASLPEDISDKEYAEICGEFRVVLKGNIRESSYLDPHDLIHGLKSDDV